MTKKKLKSRKDTEGSTKQPFDLLTLILFCLSLFSIGSKASTNSIHEELLKTPDSLKEQIHPQVKHLFHNLPLEKPRKEIRAVIRNDGRFVSTDSVFNNYEPSSFFKGIALDKGLILSNPDSIQVLLGLGNTLLSTEKGVEADFKDIMLLNFSYFYSEKENSEDEYGRLINLLSPILKDTTSIQSEAPYAMSEIQGQMTIHEIIFENFAPYYRVAISSLSFHPADGSKSFFELDIVFGKEDK